MNIIMIAIIIIIITNITYFGLLNSWCSILCSILFLFIYRILCVCVLCYKNVDIDFGPQLDHRYLAKLDD